MPMAVTPYGLTEAEHRAVGRDVPVFPRPPCLLCGSPTRSKGLAERKRAGIWVRLLRCVRPACRAVTVLLPPWAAVRVGATLGEIERVIACREACCTWRASAQAAGLGHAPGRYRHWLAEFGDVMTALLPRLSWLRLDAHEGWIAQLRPVLGEAGEGVLVALRMKLYAEDRTVLGPTCLVTLDRSRARAPPSP